MIIKKDSKPRASEGVVDLEERREEKALLTSAIRTRLKEIGDAGFRFQQAADHRGSPLPNALELGHLQIAYYSAGVPHAASVVRALSLALHGRDKTMLAKLARAAEVAVGVRAMKRGHQPSDREALYKHLCARPPSTEDFDAQAKHALAAIRNVLNAKYVAEVEDVRRARRGSDWPSVIRAAFRACGVPGAENLGKAAVVRRARVVRSKRQK